MNINVIDCIPSRTLRKYFEANPVEMSALQQATIVFNYAKKKNRLPLFRQLLEETDNEAERLFLSSAVKDSQEGVEYYSDETQEIYDEKFPHEGFPWYPFLEVCNLPVLFKRGDVIRRHRKHGWHNRVNELYYVGGVPLLIPGHCDFSDEQYLSYPLSSSVETEEDLASIHEHINICEAERASRKMLTPQEKCNYDKIQKVFRLMRLGRFYKGSELTLMKRLVARKNTRWRN
ncbi:MAG: hypothetical protein IJQ77_08455 [Synergistaceae bacterium]|nr:hypothetical protein [Synergistaceae bacterium]